MLRGPEVRRGRREVAARLMAKGTENACDDAQRDEPEQTKDGEEDCLDENLPRPPNEPSEHIQHKETEEHFHDVFLLSGEVIFWVEDPSSLHHFREIIKGGG